MEIIEERPGAWGHRHVSSRKKMAHLFPRDFIKWVWIFYWVLALKIFVSTQNLRNTVPLFHLWVAIDNYYTLYKFGFRKPNRWDPRGDKPILGYFGAPNGRFSWLFTWDPKISVFGLQICIACSRCQQLPVGEEMGQYFEDLAWIQRF